MKIGKRALLSILSLFALSLPLLAGAEEKTLSATTDGMAMINKNTAKARASAIDDAIKKAVGHGVAALISSEDITFNQEAIEEGIYANSREYIQNYKVLSEKVTGNIYQITLDAVILKSLLSKDLSALGLVSLPENLPNILLMIVEKNEIEQVDTFWWKKGRDKAPLTETENIINEIFTSRGFDVVSHEKEGLPESVSGYGVEQPDTAQLVEFGKFFGADVILYGLLSTKPDEPASGQKTSSALTTVSFLILDRGKEETVGLTEKEEKAEAENINEAGKHSLFKALNEASTEAMTKMASFARGEVNEKLLNIEMVISGVTSYGAFIKFKDLIQKNIASIKEITQRGIGGGKATLDIKMDGTPRELADKLTLIAYEDFSIDITELSEAKIEILLKKADTIPDN